MLDGAGPAMTGLVYSNQSSYRTIVPRTFWYITLVKTFPIDGRGCHVALFSLTTSSSSPLLINISSPG
ncbi:hypothetical protein V8C37DRAFT_392265 [Trichoderma ceciliae]